MPSASSAPPLPFLERLLDGEKVEWKTLGEVCDYEQPTAYLVRSTNYSDQYATPVLTAGKTFILGYTNETTGIYQASQHPTIIFDDFTTANKWVDFDFKAKSSAMKMLTSKDEKVCLLKYIYYWLNTLPADSVVGDHNRQWIGNYSQKLFPIPPLRVQSRIVEILDKFTQLEAELEAELEARNKQYDFYRNRLLDFALRNDLKGQVEWKTLGEVAELVRGNGLSKKDFSEFGVPAIHYGQIYTYYGNETEETLSFVSPTIAKKLQKVYPGNIVITNTSENVEDVCKAVLYSGNVEAVTGGHATIIRPKDYILPKYLVYFTLTLDFFTQKKRLAKGAKVIDVSAKDLAKIVLPLPPLSEQRRIVDILDRFDTLTNSISEGLPREIALRRKQYEYYRDALLRFPQPAPTA